MKKTNRILAILLVVCTIVMMCMPLSALGSEIDSVAFVSSSTDTRGASVWNGSVATGFQSGEGTSSDPYIIAYASQLAYLAKTVNSEKDTFKGKYIKLTADINLNNIEWQPIGRESLNDTMDFKGTFDGDGHKITGMKIADLNSLAVYSDRKYAGLFGCCSNGATIKNLSMSNCKVEITTPEKVSLRAGILCGGIYDNSKIENCNISGSVINKSRIRTFNSFIGIVTAVAYQTDISKCFASGKVEVKNDSNASSGYKVGGLVGVFEEGTLKECNSSVTMNIALNLWESSVEGDDKWNRGYLTVGGLLGEIWCDEKSSLEDSSSIGAIIVSADKTYAYAGGLVGRCYNYNTGKAIVLSVKKCYALSSVSASGKAYIEAGGLIGQAWNTSGKLTIEDCYSKGNVYSETWEYHESIAGGLIGNCCCSWDNEGESIGESAVVKNCKAYGNAKAVSNEADTYSPIGYPCAGGFVGYLGSNTNIEKCRAYGNVDSISLCVSGSYAYAGGFIGETNGNNTVCKSSFASGNVYISQCSNADGWDNYTSSSAGGFIGTLFTWDYQCYMQYSECYATGNVDASRGAYISIGGFAGNHMLWDYGDEEDYIAVYSNCYATGDLSAEGKNVYAGGFQSAADFGEFKNCYATGNINVKAEQPYVGGFTGDDSGWDDFVNTYSNCYRLKEQSLTANGSTVSGTQVATALTDDEMRLEKAFKGFDFNAVWTMDGDEEYSYPELRSIIDTAFTVKYVDYDGTAISTQKVFENDDAKVPEKRIRNGYTFIGWDKSWKNVTADMVITALYEEGTIDFGDTNGDDKINTSDAVALLKMSAGIQDIKPEYKKAADTNHDGNINTSDAVAILKYSAGITSDFILNG